MANHNGRKCICIICFQQTDERTLKSHHHCCTRSSVCENKFREITHWERGQFGSSYLDELSKNY